jgi:hypothetical protein
MLRVAQRYSTLSSVLFPIAKFPFLGLLLAANLEQLSPLGETWHLFPAPDFVL